MSSKVFSAGDLYSTKPLIPFRNNNTQYPVVFPAQVLDVCLDTSSPLFGDSTDIGKIQFKAMGPAAAAIDQYENLVASVAVPLSRNVVRYPIPGEQVMIYVAAGDFQSNYSEEQVQYKAYYDQVVSNNLNPTYNSSPFIATTPNKVEKDSNVPLQSAETRFDNRVTDLDAYKEGGNTKIFKQLRPFEGDIILQGRFGNTIRFGSTSGVKQNPWSKPSSPGISGDPIMLLRVDREYTTSATDMIIEEDVDKDDASIILCSSQKIEMQLSCNQQKTWSVTPGTVTRKRSAGSGITSTSEQGITDATAAIGSADADASSKAIDITQAEIVQSTDSIQSSQIEIPPNP